MTILVSSSHPPAIKIELFPTFLNRLRHGSEVVWINAAAEMQQCGSRNSPRPRQSQGASKIEHLPLLFECQMVQLYANFLFETCMDHRFPPVSWMGTVSGNSELMIFQE